MRKLAWPAISEFTFTSRSAEAAFARSQQGDRADRAAADTSLLRGRVVVDASWDDSRFHLRLDDESALRVSVDVGGRVDWRRTTFHESSVLAQRIGVPPVRLRMPADEWVWDPSDLFARRIGQEVKRIAPGKVWLRLYIGDMRPLWFWPFVDSQTNEWFLYWHDTDSD